MLPVLRDHDTIRPRLSPPWDHTYLLLVISTHDSLLSLAM